MHSLWHIHIPMGCLNMKTTEYFKPISVITTKFPLKKYHVIFVVSHTDTHTRIAHLDTINGIYKTSRTITQAQFKNGYRPLNKSEVLQFVEE